MPSLREIIKNTAQFADSLLITLPDGSQANLGAIRAQEADELKAFTKQQEEIQKGKDALAAAQAKLEADTSVLRAAEARTATLFAELQAKGASPEIARAAAAAATGIDPLAQHRQDPAFKPVIEQLDFLKKQNESILNEHLKKITDTFQQIAKGYVNDRVSDLLERIPNRDVKVTDEAIIQHALKNNIMTATGVPDVRKAYKELTAQSELDAKIAEAVKAEREKVLAEVAATGPTPGRPGLTFTQPAQAQTQQRFTSLDAALTAAAKDPEIWRDFGKV